MACRQHQKGAQQWFPKVLQQCCLRPNYSLRRQLIAGYGITAFVTISIVVFMATIAARRAGSEVKEESIKLFETQLDAILQESGVLTGDILHKKMNGLRGSVSLLTEVVRDRIVGYPNEGWENDTHVPFVDRDSGERMYPLKAKLLPRDWMLQSNLNDTNRAEHIQERADYDSFSLYTTRWNTETAMFTFQGNCDPNQTDVDQPGYYPFCNDDYNDASIGGKINPTTSPDELVALEQKGADIGVFLKAIFEAQPAVLSVGVIFFNSGAGANVIFPSEPTAYQAEYTSAGCDWMRKINSNTGRPYATEEQINRCTPVGTRASVREYNGMERELCADQALHPGETRIYGPYSDASRSSWRLTFGKAAFDRLTGEFIACTAIDVSLIQAEILLEFVSKDMPSDMVVTKPDGIVVVGAVGTSTNNDTNPTKIYDTDFIDEETYNELTNDLAFWEGVWDIESAKNKYNFSVYSNGKYYTVFPSPIPPDDYDLNYKPDFLIFGSIDAEVQDNIIGDIDEMIDKDVDRLIIVTVALGAIGLCCLLIVVSIEAQVLTQPLKWMESKAWQIVNHTDKRVGDSLIVTVAAPLELGEGQDGQDDENEITKCHHFFSCMPKTEVQELVSEFRSMVSGFSGEGASRVAVSRGTETRNVVTWKEEFRQFYNLSPSLEIKLKEEMNLNMIGTRSVSRRISTSNIIRRGSLLPKLDTADFAKIVAVENLDDVAELNANAAQFRSTQISGESTTELRSSSIITKRAASLMQMMQKEDSEQFSRPPTRINLGSNIQHIGDRRSTEETVDDHSIRILKSPLYWNVLCWIVLPLLLSIIAIMAFVGFSISDTFPKWINEANNTSFELEVKHLNSSANLIVKHIEQVFEEPLRDLHTISRMSGWLLFGAVNRSDSFTDFEMDFVEECKYYDNVSECPFETNNTRSPCDCEWNDPWERTCQNRTTSDHRDVQKMWYLNQKRNESRSYPTVDNSPESTSWYTDPNEMQGSGKGSNAEGHLTAYDRLRVASALSTVILPVYNYGADSRVGGSPITAMAGYISFEADGAFYGYAGCNYDAAGFSQFQSSDANNAYLVNPDLCPRGKFGYDPRCRSWYANTKREALDSDDGLYISPPHKFATVDDIGNTAASALIDPKSGAFVGNTLVDFSTSEISKIVEESDVEFYAVILPNATDGQNVVASSEFIDESTPKSIFDLLMPYDPPNSTNKEYFAEIIEDMENGGAGSNCSLYRTNEDGMQQRFCYAYEPIFNRELRPVRPDDFSRGAEHYIQFLYSIIMFEEVDAFSSEYMKRSDDIDRVLRKTLITYIIMTSLTTWICILVTATISLYVTRPMIQLLRTVKQVNAGRIEDDIPPLTGGSREVHRVYTSFAKLYKIVRMSNSAFFVGDLNLAHHIALDALQLFRKIGDEKAIAIACNNMGNTLLALMVEYREAGTCMILDDDNDDGKCCTKAAIDYYTEAVAAGTRDFETVESDAEKAKFAQQLADRHFNRAMCLLHTADDPCAAATRSDAKETALDDLFLARQYDQGVKEYMLHTKTLLKNSDIIFERSLRRLHGLAALIDIDPDVWNVWDIYELVDQADLMLQAAWNQDTAPLFNNVKKTGRLQELEGAVTGIELSSGKGNDAVLLATRMLVEDEYILDSAFIEAADCILQYSRDVDGNDDDGDGDGDGDGGYVDDDNDNHNHNHNHNEGTTNNNCWSGSSSMTKLRQEFKMMRKSGMRNALDIGRSFVFCIELRGQWNGTPLLRNLQNACLAFYNENCQTSDSVGMVTFDPQDGTLRRLHPATREEGETLQREEIVAATTGVACSKFTSALAGAIDMALDVESSAARDVCLLYISDGGAFDEKLYSSLRHKIERSVRSNKNKTSSIIDLVVIGLEVNENFNNNNNNNSNSINSDNYFAESCKSLSLATRSRSSMYLEAEDCTINEAFQQATSVLNSGTSFAGNRLQHALTMQKF